MILCHLVSPIVNQTRDFEALLRDGFMEETARKINRDLF